MKLNWDHYSDQPEVIRDKAFKKKIYKQTRWDSFKLITTNLIAYPIAFLAYWLIPAKQMSVESQNFFGMSINVDKNPDETKALIDDLQVKNLLIRVPLSDIENLQAYIEFAEQFNNKNILITILQDRRHVEDLALLRQSLDQIFQQFSPLTTRFQIGNAINRKKWAFFSMDEYLHFYKVAYDLKKQNYPNLTLLGSSIIDFEYYFTIRTLFNLHSVYFDECSSLLYVDRRGAPENTQMGLDLTKKLYFLQTILRLSPKTGNEIVISETNWPIKNTAPYAPTGEKECVSLDDHANYLVRYYLLALASGAVKNVYWHQLIAPGYGLIDNRDGKLTKYPAYYAFKTMLSLLDDMKFVALSKKNKCYRMTFNHISKADTMTVYWALEPCSINHSTITHNTINHNNQQLISRDGAIINTHHKTTEKQPEVIQVGKEPVYLLTKNKS